MQSLINTYACIMTYKLYFVSGCCNCSEVSLEYSQRIKKVVEELLKGISKSLGLEEWYIDKAMNMSSGLQVLVANLYPPCPQPEHAMGLPPHSDYGLLTVLTQNEVGGLQVQHQGKWFNVNLIPNSLLVNIGDHLEVNSYLPCSSFPLIKCSPVQVLQQDKRDASKHCLVEKTDQIEPR